MPTAALVREVLRIGLLIFLGLIFAVGVVAVTASLAYFGLQSESSGGRRSASVAMLTFASLWTGGAALAAARAVQDRLIGWPALAVALGVVGFFLAIVLAPT